MRTHTTRPHRAAAAVSVAVAALLVGTTAPAAHAAPGDKPTASQGKRAGEERAAERSRGHNKGGSGTKAGKRSAPNDERGARAERSDRTKTSGDNRASSNKDGKGHNDRWQAQADPDGDENGGIDQPGGDGGYDPKGWDGNNGSGNDPDCEDDNRGKGLPGHCKTRPQADQPQPEPQQPAVPQQSEGENKEDDSDEGGAPGETPTPSPAPALPDAGDAVGQAVTDVLGVQRAVGAGSIDTAETAAPASARTPVAEQAGVLPDTGAGASTLALLAGGVAAAGAGTVLVRRSRASRA